MNLLINSKYKFIISLLLMTNSLISFGQTDYLPVGATVSKLSTDQFSFLEGPVWYNDSALLFTEQVSPFKIFQYNPQGGTFSIFRDNLQKVNGLTLNKDGLLLACEEGAKRLVSIDGTAITALATSYNGTVFNKPNDLIADAKGGIYFTDPPNAAVYYLSSAGVVSKINSTAIRPNGIILSPNGSTLYVSDTQGKYVYSWSIAQDGSISSSIQFATLNLVAGKTTSLADGMAIDVNGNLYVTTELGVQVISASGAHLGTISVPEKPANCDFGGTDMKTLYITATKNLYKIDLNYPGFTVFKNKTLAIDKNQFQDNSFIMFPIPATESVQYKINESAIHEILIFNSLGTRVRTIAGNGNSGIIMTNDLAAGIYFAKLTTTGSKQNSFIRNFIVTK